MPESHSGLQSWLISSDLHAGAAHLLCFIVHAVIINSCSHAQNVKVWGVIATVMSLVIVLARRTGTRPFTECVFTVQRACFVHAAMCRRSCNVSCGTCTCCKFCKCQECVSTCVPSCLLSLCQHMHDTRLTFLSSKHLSAVVWLSYALSICQHLCGIPIY